ncbi:toprim domain-containing protein [Chromohalobacter sp. 296-RDG]|uniref:toprim domain-containing protein n=1 Tax=Chromohalobacter sp. 296-RDG TaxID=2994062 RepID=UPI00246893AF|nr:toprim domain-containing protein [Chromohalobacter sp. 296-RDG]
MKTPAPGKGQAQSKNHTDHYGHPYLERKGIALADLQAVCRVGVTVEVGEVRCHGADDWRGSMIFRELVDAAGASSGFERILPEKIQKAEDAKPGDKFTTPGSKVSGTFTPIGFAPTDLLSLSGPLVICAGLADGYSIHAATGHPVACCVGEMMVASVAKVLRTAAGRAELLVAVDNDEAGHRAAERAGTKWACPARLKDWSDVRQQEGLDAVKEQLLATREQASTDQEDKDGEDEDKRQSQTDLIVAFVQAWNDLFHDDNDVAYAWSRATGEVWSIGSRSFRHWLTAEFYAQHEKAVRDQALREARMTLEGIAMKDYRQVHIRSAGGDGHYWLDLGIPGSSRCVHLRSGAWTIEEQCELMFCRSESAQPLPEPVRHGSIEPLWCVANVPESARLLVVAWLVECLRPDTPYPIIELLGEQGSGKSGTQSALRRLIDPNAADLRGTPKSAEDLFVSGGVNHVISIENASHLPAQLQDALCVVATGGGFARRKLYTDGDESVIQLKRPIILNGIAAAVTQQDLVSRTITVELPVIQDAQAKDRMDADFEANRPTIIGGLLDIAAQALKLLPDMALPSHRRPRLVEFAYLGMAVAKAMDHDPEEFMKQFDAARQDGLERTLEASPVATAIRDWAEIHPDETRDEPAKRWLAILADYKPTGADAWPRSGKGLGDAMRRSAPALRQLGIECKSLGKGGGGIIRWRIGKKVPEPMSHTSQSHSSNDDGRCDFVTSGTSYQRNSLPKASGEEF